MFKFNVLQRPLIRKCSSFCYRWRKEIAIFAFSYSIPYAFLRPVTCTGPSMQPTLNEPKCYLLVRVGFLFYPFPLKIGDVVLCKNPHNADRDDVVKRIIAIGPNQQIVCHPRGWKANARSLLSIVDLKDENDVWLQGDNMAQSCDSRAYGVVHREQIYGKVCLELYPTFKRIYRTLEFAGQEDMYWQLLNASC